MSAAFPNSFAADIVLRETLNKSILAPLRHGFSRRGIDGCAIIQRIPRMAASLTQCCSISCTGRKLRKKTRCGV